MSNLIRFEFYNNFDIWYDLYQENGGDPNYVINMMISFLKLKYGCIYKNLYKGGNGDLFGNGYIDGYGYLHGTGYGYAHGIAYGYANGCACGCGCANYLNENEIGNGNIFGDGTF